MAKRKIDDFIIETQKVDVFKILDRMIRRNFENTPYDNIERLADIINYNANWKKHYIKRKEIVLEIQNVLHIFCYFENRYSDNIENNPDIIGQTNNITYDSHGTGSIYQVFLGAGATFWKKFSVGAEGIYYFGNIDKVTNMEYTDASYRSINSGSELMLRGFTGKFGLQYEQNLGGDVSMVVGVTYKLGTKMKGYATNYRYAVQSGVVDTLSHSIDTLKHSGSVRFGNEIGVGIAFKGGEKWSVEFDYVMSDWRRSGIDNTYGFSAIGESTFTSSVSHSFRAGFEIVPNRNDIRYYLKRCAYRAGVYYDQSYYKFNGTNVNSMGITLGLTLPVFRWYNGLSLGVDLGQKSSMKNNMVRERYAMIVIGFNIHDIWFQKPRYN